MSKEQIFETLVLSGHDMKVEMKNWHEKLSATIIIIKFNVQ